MFESGGGWGPPPFIRAAEFIRLSHAFLLPTGYGNISPSTEFGRFFCVMYGFIGIPLAGILFAAIGDFFSTKLLKAHERTKSRSSSPRRALIISTIMYLIPGFLMFLILPAGVFMILEKWSFIQGFYYSFVTLTTIGFGDFVAGKQN